MNQFDKIDRHFNVAFGVIIVAVLGAWSGIGFVIYSLLTHYGIV